MKPDKIYVFLASLIILSSFLWIISCSHDAKIADLPEVCFEGEVLPIFTNSCAIAGCHDGQGETRLVLNNYADISRRVSAGNPNGSSLYKAIIAKSGQNMMPPKQPLSFQNRTIIRLWIEQGAQNTTCPQTTGTGGDPGNSGNTAVIARACFARDILPVLVSKCGIAQCHDAISHKEGYNYTSYATTMGSVTAGNPTGSRLYKVIKSGTGESKMPPTNYAQLTTAEIDSIGKWIGYGALNENCGEVCDTISPVTFSGTIWPIIQSTCTGCHTGAAPSGNVLLASYTNVAAVASSGSLIKSLNGTGVTKMPPSGSFTPCRIRQFEIWVNNGFLNN